MKPRFIQHPFHAQKRRRENAARRSSSLAHWLQLIGGGAVLAALPASGQYALQNARDFQGLLVTPPSQAGAAPLQPRPYNMKLGPTLWNFGAGLNVAWTSNAQVTSSGTEGDFMFTPTGTVSMTVPLSERASLDFNLTAGYTFYVKNSDLGSFYVSPGSQLAYSMFIGEVKLAFFNSLTMTQFSYQDPTVGANNANAQTLANSVGVVASTQLDRTQLSSGFTHMNNWQLSGTGGAGDSASQNLFGQAGYQILPELTVGVQGGLTWTSFNNSGQGYIDALSNGFLWNIGPFGEWTISKNLSFHASVGYSDYRQNYRNASLGTTSSSSVYFQLALTHTVNEWLSYTLSGGQSVTPSTFSGPTEAYTANASATWAVIEKVGLSTSFGYSSGQSITLFQPESYSWYNLGIAASRPFNDHLNASLSYTWTHRISGGSGGDFDVNNVTLSLNYKF